MVQISPVTGLQELRCRIRPSECSLNIRLRPEGQRDFENSSETEQLGRDTPIDEVLRTSNGSCLMRFSDNRELTK